MSIGSRQFGSNLCCWLLPAVPDVNRFSFLSPCLAGMYVLACPLKRSYWLPLTLLCSLSFRSVLFLFLQHPINFRECDFGLSHCFKRPEQGSDAHLHFTFPHLKDLLHHHHAAATVVAANTNAPTSTINPALSAAALGASPSSAVLGLELPIKPAALATNGAGLSFALPPNSNDPAPMVSVVTASTPLPPTSPASTLRSSDSSASSASGAGRAL
jgi:hypothetical protein